MSKVNNVTKSPTAGNQDDFPDEEDLYKLAKLLEKYAPHDDRFDLNVEGLHVLRAYKNNT